MKIGLTSPSGGRYLAEGDTSAVCRGRLIDGALFEAVDVVNIVSPGKGGGNSGKGNKK